MFFSKKLCISLYTKYRIFSIGGTWLPTYKNKYPNFKKCSGGYN
jgi:hypothetical protein